MKATLTTPDPPSRRQKWFAFLFFALFLAGGLSLVRDYGLAWDEPEQAKIGAMAVRYITEGDEALLTDWNKYHGPGFEILLTAVQSIVRPRDARSLYLLRHVANFSMHFLGVVSFYLLCRRRFGDWKVALFGSALLILSPRIFGQAFYNSKDLPFLSMFIISIYTLVRFLESDRLGWAVMHGAASGFLVDIRVMGLLVPVLTGLLYAKQIIAPSATGRGRALLRALVCGLVFFGVMLLFWPILWNGPFHHLIQAVREMKRFPWNGSVLYWGHVIRATDVPWHYTPIWILISTPPLYIALFLIGLAYTGWRLAVTPRVFLASRSVDFIALVWLGVPLLAVVGFHSVLYNAWRHNYYVYPAILLIALVGLTELRKAIDQRLSGIWRGVASATLAMLVVLGMASTAVSMARAHPYEDVYFNSLVGGTQGARSRFELDYWGISYLSGLEAVLRDHPSGAVTLFVDSYPGRINVQMLSPEDRARIAYVDEPARAMYFVGNRDQCRVGDQPCQRPIHEVQVEGVPLLSVFRLPGARVSTTPTP